MCYTLTMSDSSPTPSSPVPLPYTLDNVSAEWLTSRLTEIEAKVGKDVIFIRGTILPGLDLTVRMALEHLQERRESSLVILSTPGGFVEVVARISDTLRHFYETVDFLIPDEAMSAGTVLALSGDAILMDYFSRLGPIDPQVERDGQPVPGLSYLRQYETLIKKASEGKLTEPEYILLNKLDLAELHKIQLASDLSQSLIKEWLPKYKFKDWVKHKNGRPVDHEEKVTRAGEIADELNNHQRWLTHARGIDMKTMRELGLKIDDFGEDSELKGLVWRYFWAAREYAHKVGYHHYFVQTRRFL